MFTGIVEAVGEISEIREAAGFRQIRVRTPDTIEGLREGSSIATNGVCITAREVGPVGFIADLSHETLERTTLGHARVGSHVNIERPLRADSRLDGHIVQGHVDGTGRVLGFQRQGDDWNLEIGYDALHRSRLVWKGSIAVDGISLTIAGLNDSCFGVAIIPFTMEHTTLKYIREGDRVNLEFDILAKYVERLAEPYLERLRASSSEP